MTDDSGLPPIEPLIDVRSPGERWAESGRAGFALARERLEHQRLDVVALVWMICIVAIVGCEIYSALRFGSTGDFPGTGDWWFRLQLLSETAGTVAVFGGIVGVALAVVFAGRTSRFALSLAALAGLWSAVAGVLGLVVTFHNSQLTPTRTIDGKITSVISYVGYVGLGLVVTIIAWQCSLSDQASAALS